MLSVDMGPTYNFIVTIIAEPSQHLRTCKSIVKKFNVLLQRHSPYQFTVN